MTLERCGDLLSDLLHESAALGAAGLGGVCPSGSGRLGGRFPCLSYLDSVFIAQQRNA